MRVLRNGAVGRKHTHTRHVEDGLACPGVGVAVEGVHAVLRGDVAGVVGQQQVRVAPVHQRVVDLLVTAGLSGAEDAALHCIQHCFQLRVRQVECTRLVTGGADGGHLGCGVAEDEDVVQAHVFADLDIGPVECANGECAAERELHVAGARRLGACGGNLL